MRLYFWFRRTVAVLLPPIRLDPLDYGMYHEEVVDLRQRLEVRDG